ERGWHLRKYAIPLLALRSIVIANALDPSDDISFMSYVQPSWGPGRPSESVVQEWNTFSEEPVDSSTTLTSFFGFWTGVGLGSDFSSVFRRCPWIDVFHYEIDTHGKRIIPVFSGSRSLWQPPHLLVLPSLLPYDLTQKLIGSLNEMDEPTGE